MPRRVGGRGRHVSVPHGCRRPLDWLDLGDRVERVIFARVTSRSSHSGAIRVLRAERGGLLVDVGGDGATVRAFLAVRAGALPAVQAAIVRRYPAANPAP